MTTRKPTGFHTEGQGIDRKVIPHFESTGQVGKHSAFVHPSREKMHAARAQTMYERNDNDTEVFGQNTDNKIITFVDNTSEITDKYVEEKTMPLLASMQKATKRFMQQQYPKQAEQHLKEEDSPFYEGYSGLRTYIASGLKVESEKLYRKNNLGWLQRGMQDTWFKDGKYEKLPERFEGLPFKKLVFLMATHKRQTPLTMYREEASTKHVKLGERVSFKQPRSFSTRPQAMMGETTYVVQNSKRGTRVSSLSNFIGESEMISFNPKGYVVVKTETKTWYGKPSHYVVHLKEIGA